MLEHDREVNGRRADGQRRQATEQIRPDGGRPGADLLVRVDFEGGQRVISQFILRHQGERCLVSAGRHFQIDQPGPREGE